MNLLGGPPRRARAKRIAACVLCVLVAGAAIAGWRLQRATDTTLVDPIAVPADVELRSGDIIVAGGVSLQSRLVRQMAADNRYSHVGMIQATPEGLFVIHAAPKGEGDGGVGDKVARIPLTLFLAERGYVTVRVMRLNAEAAAAKQVAEDACACAAHYVEQAVPFDGAFDLADQQALYCSELVYLAYADAGYQWPEGLVSSVSTLVVDGPVILPDAFTRCEDFDIIWQHEPTDTKGKR